MKRFDNSTRALVLVAGDAIAYFFSLILTLGIRYGEIPTRSLIAIHIPSFALLIAIFILVTFSAGLYDKRSALFRSNSQGMLVRIQMMNAVIGIIFFYFAPVVIAPKANLFIYFVVSTALLFLWRSIMFPVISASRAQAAVLVGTGNDIQDLHDEVSGGLRSGIVFREQVVPAATPEATVALIDAAVKRTGAAVIVADLHDPAIECTLPFLYSLIFSGIQIIEASRLYEAVFDRIPLSLVGERWLVENSSTALGTRRVYDVLKRAMDIALAGCAGIISLLAYPFVYAAIKFDDGGPLFIAQERIGRNGKTVRIVKFRTMSGNDSGRYGTGGVTAHTVTRIGKYLRVSRIDELPQLWNVVKGDLSLIGPRPELPSLTAVYEKEIPYYNARHLVKPGLSGWAQIYHEAHPHHHVATEETRNKLSYDLFYIKNRSFMLDLKIALRTLQILLKKSGR